MEEKEEMGNRESFEAVAEEKIKRAVAGAVKEAADELGDQWSGETITVKTEVSVGETPESDFRPWRQALSFAVRMTVYAAVFEVAISGISLHTPVSDYWRGVSGVVLFLPAMAIQRIIIDKVAGIFRKKR